MTFSILFYIFNLFIEVAPEMYQEVCWSVKNKISKSCAGSYAKLKPNGILSILYTQYIKLLVVELSNQS